jgi:predicted RNA-binding protein associated with RNAse of E/G family
VGGQAVILKSETHFHRLDLTRQAGFIVTIYDEDGLKLAATAPLATPAEAFSEARKIVDNKVEGPRR